MSMLRDYYVRKIWLELEGKIPKVGQSKNTSLFMLILNSKQLSTHFSKWLKYCFILKNKLMLSQRNLKRVHARILHDFDSLGANAYLLFGGLLYPHALSHGNFVAHERFYIPSFLPQHYILTTLNRVFEMYKLKG